LAKYKIKTHSGAKRRFSITGSGKILSRKIGVNNMRRKKRGQTLRQIGGKLAISPHNEKRLRRLLPYSK
jgi:large subunit ribosomal protein L35